MSVDAAAGELGIKADTTGLPWWREVTRDQWRAFTAAFERMLTTSTEEDAR